MNPMDQSSLTLASALIPGWGVDRKEKDRPGVPSETTVPAPLQGAQEIQLSHEGVPAIVAPNRFITPVFSSANPPRGLSGLLRRAAYRFPDYRSRRWLLLMVADRVDAIEHAPLTMMRVAGGLSVLAMLAAIIRGSSARRWR
jgi:hypothetical protein